jgi:hypothetical protein
VYLYQSIKTLAVPPLWREMGMWSILALAGSKVVISHGTQRGA